MRGVAEVICGRLSEGEASRRCALDGCGWWVLTQSKLNGKSDQKFLERVPPVRDCEKPNIELVLKTTLSSTGDCIA